MREYLLVATIALALVTVTAALPATAQTKLPNNDPLIGSWCNKSGQYKRGSCFDVPDGYLTISQDGYGGHEVSCTFLEVKRIPDGVEAYSECLAGSLYQFDRVTLQISGKQLRYKDIATTHTAEQTETFCVSVQETPDGYLNLREGPGMKFKAKAKLVFGDYLEADAKNKEWTHVTSVTRMEKGGRKVDGWVYSKYVQKFACENEPYENPPKVGLTIPLTVEEISLREDPPEDET
jgi:hypothetical protein